MATEKLRSLNSCGTALLSAEVCEMLDLLAAYGRKKRMAAEANGEQQKLSNYQKVIDEANEYLSRFEKEEKLNGKSA